MTAPLRASDPIVVNVALGERSYDIVIGRGQLTAPDDDVVAALAERDVDDDRIAGAQRRSHDRRSPSAGGPGIAQATRICPASARTISSTILSCSTSRDCTV